VARRDEARSFDAPGAEFTHRDGKCSFEVLIDDFELSSDAALVRLARIVHAADVAEDRDSDPLGAGLEAIGAGGVLAEPDLRLLDKGTFVYDALYAWCQAHPCDPRMTRLTGSPERATDGEVKEQPAAAPSHRSPDRSSSR
jgi:hypothetical protein